MGAFETPRFHIYALNGKALPTLSPLAQKTDKSVLSAQNPLESQCDLYVLKKNLLPSAAGGRKKHGSFYTGAKGALVL